MSKHTLQTYFMAAVTVYKGVESYSVKQILIPSTKQVNKIKTK